MASGGKRDGAGRRVEPNPAKTRTIRLSDDDYKLFLENGGAKTLRYLIKNNKFKKEA